MIALCKLFFLVFSIFASNVAAVGGCRQCSGTLTLNWNDYATQAQADQIVASHLAACATGKQYVITGVSQQGPCASSQGKSGCMVWVYSLAVGRYCGSATNVSKVRSEPKYKYFCLTGGRCSVTSTLKMNCTPNIACAGTCLPQNC